MGKSEFRGGVKVVGEHSPPRAPLFFRLVREFIKQFNLNLTPFRMDGNTWYAVNGVRARMDQVNQNPDVLKYPVNPSEKGKSATQLYREALDKVRAHSGGMRPRASERR